MLYFMYDASDNIIGFKDNTNTYYYIKNMQQDIIGIMDSNYNIIATYEYDSWGRILSIKDNNGIEITDKTHIAYINPFRYRSYYYDEEIELYYLNSRYYNPTWGRFINGDSYGGTIGAVLSHNIYGYCLNNPIVNDDNKGQFPTKRFRGRDKLLPHNTSSSRESDKKNKYMACSCIFDRDCGWSISVCRYSCRYCSYWYSRRNVI